jgi:hypothetical protein
MPTPTAPWLTDQEKAHLQQQSLDWLTADLAGQRQLLQQPTTAVQVQMDLQHWKQPGSRHVASAARHW